MKITKFLCRRLLPNLVARTCEMPIPRSGSKGEEVNCFVVYIEKNGGPHLFVTRVEGEDLICLGWDGTRFCHDVTIPLDEINFKDISVHHYYGLAQVRYTGIYDLAINRLTLWPYIKIHLTRVAERLGQHAFNKKKLVTKQKVDLLRVLLSRHLEGETSFDSLHLMSELYTTKWILHPDGDAQRRKLDLHLDALAHTGELQRQQDGYVLTGRALSAIEEYEEQERRYTENVMTQKRMVWLTLAIVLLTLVQAGVVKLPLLLDFSR